MKTLTITHEQAQQLVSTGSEEPTDWHRVEETTDWEVSPGWGLQYKQVIFEELETEETCFYKLECRRYLGHAGNWIYQFELNCPAVHEVTETRVFKTWMPM